MRVTSTCIKGGKRGLADQNDAEPPTELEPEADGARVTDHAGPGRRKSKGDLPLNGMQECQKGRHVREMSGMPCYPRIKRAV